MKNSFGFDNSFRELDYIPRSQRQKRKSFRKIINEAETRQRGKKDILPRLLSAAAVLAACFLFSIIIYSDDYMNRGSNSSAVMGNSVITKTAVSISESEKSFSAEGPYSPGIATIQDEKWEEAARKAINSAHSVNTALTSKPQYDVQFMLKGKEPLKLKIWEEDGEVIFRTLASEEYYILSSEESNLFLQYLKAVTKSVEKNP
ncbi:hypothetical protein [Cytobacillus sp. NCCP-133]|uniref:hypothetical protein n=1 Tax=Cytobacillus sp. NCCP-133 TaxID=766848 RepID=UPI00222FCA0D|nr:hypothetical protein [Cytobacillus sp. NCCP-133]GLB60470.1 hypothetical protein NCCP133_26020 [Cytobacillus sp. NCCP-133]